MSTVVMAGGGLASWYVMSRLMAQGEAVEVWYAEADQHDEALTGPFLDHVARLGLPLVRHDLRDELAVLGLELARAQARHRNGYWNTTGLLRVGLVTACARWMSGERDAAPAVAHGCVGLGNDQRRFHNLFGDLRPDVTVRTELADRALAGEDLTRRRMIEQIERELGWSPPALADKAEWSSDGSLLGVSHEGEAIEAHDRDWTRAPFVMTADPLRCEGAEDVVIGFSGGALTRVGTVTGDARALLGEANRRAGAAGLGRLGVMEDRLKGTKCRGVYEAPGLTLLGLAWDAAQELCLSSSDLDVLEGLSRGLASDVYGGRWHTDQSASRRAAIDELCRDVSGEVEMTLHCGRGVPRRLRVEKTHAHVERRFASGGIAWS